MSAECRFVRHDREFQGKQALTYREGITAESVESRGICMQLLTMPPGIRSLVHLHEGHETAILMLDGVGGMLWGEQLEHDTVVEAGMFIYIPAGVPHLPYNDSGAPISAVLSRTDPNEQESVVLLPHLEAVADAKLAHRGLRVPGLEVGMAANQSGTSSGA